MGKWEAGKQEGLGREGGLCRHQPSPSVRQRRSLLGGGGSALKASCFWSTLGAAEPAITPPALAPQCLLLPEVWVTLSSSPWTVYACSDLVGEAPPRSPDIGPTSSVAQLSCILSRSAPLALVLGDLGPLSLSISELQFAGTGQCENWIRWLPLSLGAHVSWAPCAGGSKSQVFATSGAFCLEKLRAVKEEVGLCRT